MEISAPCGTMQQINKLWEEEAHNGGYGSVFDYRAAKAGYNSPEAVKQLQEKLGINADGKWG